MYTDFSKAAGRSLLQKAMSCAPYWFDGIAADHMQCHMCSATSCTPDMLGTRPSSAHADTWITHALGQAECSSRLRSLAGRQEPAPSESFKFSIPFSIPRIPFVNDQEDFANFNLLQPEALQVDSATRCLNRRKATRNETAPAVCWPEEQANRLLGEIRSPIIRLLNTNPMSNRHESAMANDQQANESNAAPQPRLHLASNVARKSRSSLPSRMFHSHSRI